MQQYRTKSSFYLTETLDHPSTIGISKRASTVDHCARSYNAQVEAFEKEDMRIDQVCGLRYDDAIV